MKKLIILLAASVSLSAFAADRELICRVNPQACAAMARNDAIQQRMQNNKCAMLKKQLMNAPEPQRTINLRQLQKTGCL